MNRRRKIIIGTGVAAGLWSLLVAGVIGGVVGYFAASSFGNPLNRTFTALTGQTIQVTNEESAVINVVDRASPAVVSIVAKGVDPFSGNLAEQGAGTGFIVDGGGIVVTNSHVVADATSVYTVVTKDKKTYSAKSISRDPVNDVAILKIDGSNFPHLTLGDSSAIKVGQDVIAIGNALGKFDNTVTTGVVSGVGRGITATDQLGNQTESLEGLIQTDAAINPGNSGGPLLDLAGDVIGIDTAAASDAQNIGFAVPVNTVKTILTNYLKNGRIVRPFLGVGTVIITSDVASTNNLVEGALVRTVVPDSAADKAGIKAGDIITEVEGQKINQDNSLAKAISTHQPGNTITIKLWRGGDTITVRATLTEAPSS
jgi:serine protease Do